MKGEVGGGRSGRWRGREDEEGGEGVGGGERTTWSYSKKRWVREVGGPGRLKGRACCGDDQR